MVFMCITDKEEKKIHTQTGQPTEPAPLSNKTLIFTGNYTGNCSLLAVLESALCKL